jgi:hypothetical protein
MDTMQSVLQLRIAHHMSLQIRGELPDVVHFQA